MGISVIKTVNCSTNIDNIIIDFDGKSDFFPWRNGSQ